LLVDKLFLIPYNFFRLFENYFESNSLSWEKLHSVTTDGAANMTGHQAGLIAKIREKNQNVNHIHCTIHRLQLATKNISGNLKTTFESSIKLINFIRARARNHRVFQKICDDLRQTFPI
jgi:hypothetical protein